MEHGIISLMNKSKYQSNTRLPLYTTYSQIQTPKSSEFDLVSTDKQFTDDDDDDPLKGISENDEMVDRYRDNTMYHQRLFNNRSGFIILDHEDKNINKDIIHFDVDDILISKDRSRNNEYNKCRCPKCHVKSEKENQSEIIGVQSIHRGDNKNHEIQYRSTEGFSQLDEKTTASEKHMDKKLTKGKISHDDDDMIKEYKVISNMIRLRCNLAKMHSNDTPYVRRKNYHDKYINAYGKGLPHDDNGFVDSNEMNKLLEAIRERDNDKLNTIKLGGKMRLLNPSAAWSQDLFGKNSNSYRYSESPALCSDRMAAQMVELYCMSIARDIPFSQYKTCPIIADCCSYLNSLRSYPQVKGKVNPYNIFRGPMYGDLQGNYISQFLLRDIRINRQKYFTILEGCDFMKSWDSAISCQNGNPIECPPSYRNIPRYLITGRDLASYVATDNIIHTFHNTLHILMDINVPMNSGIFNSSVEENYLNMGFYDIQASLVMIARNSLLAGWYAKWNSLFPRPEAYGIEVERVYRNNKNIFNISYELLRNPVLELIRARNGTNLLSQVYNIGSPLSPSTPSGCAVVAGACVTVLKFFFDTNYEIDVYEPDNDGQNLIKTDKKTTVGDELNKLASNIAIGRLWAGVNYYMDAISGLKRGEKVAISCLSEMVHRYPTLVNIPIHRFNDTIVTISN